jgi:hypothetical protein
MSVAAKRSSVLQPQGFSKPWETSRMQNLDAAKYSTFAAH